MPEVIVYGCLICGTIYRAEKLNFGISPKEINCEICEGTATKNYTELFRGKSDYIIVQPNEKQLELHRESEAKFYKRFRFSDWECNSLFDYEIEKIRQGFLVLIKRP